MSNEKKTKNVLNDLLSKIDKVALKKTSNRMMKDRKCTEEQWFITERIRQEIT